MWCGSLHLSLSLSLFGEGWEEGAGPWDPSLMLHKNSPFPLKHTHTHTYKGNTNPNTQAHMQRNHTHIQQAPPLQTDSSNPQEKKETIILELWTTVNSKDIHDNQSRNSFQSAV